MYCRPGHLYKLKKSPRNILGLNNSLIVIKGSFFLHTLGFLALTGVLLHISGPRQLIIYHDHRR